MNDPLQRYLMRGLLVDSLLKLFCLLVSVQLKNELVEIAVDRLAQIIQVAKTTECLSGRKCKCKCPLFQQLAASLQQWRTLHEILGGGEYQGPCKIYMSVPWKGGPGACSHRKILKS